MINNFADTVLKLTLKDVKIDVSDTGTDNYFNPKAGKAALSVQGSGDVEIELDGKNELKSGFYKAGLEKNTSAGKLTLKDDNKEAERSGRHFLCRHNTMGFRYRSHRSSRLSG